MTIYRIGYDPQGHTSGQNRGEIGLRNKVCTIEQPSFHRLKAIRITLVTRSYLSNLGRYSRDRYSLIQSSRLYCPSLSSPPFTQYIPRIPPSAIHHLPATYHLLCLSPHNRRAAPCQIMIKSDAPIAITCMPHTTHQETDTSCPGPRSLGSRSCSHLEASVRRSCPGMPMAKPIRTI